MDPGGCNKPKWYAAGRIACFYVLGLIIGCPTQRLPSEYTAHVVQPQGRAIGPRTIVQPMHYILVQFATSVQIKPKRGFSSLRGDVGRRARALRAPCACLAPRKKAATTMVPSCAEEKTMRLVAKGVSISLSDRQWSVSCTPTDLGCRAHAVQITPFTAHFYACDGVECLVSAPYRPCPARSAPWSRKSGAAGVGRRGLHLHLCHA